MEEQKLPEEQKPVEIVNEQYFDDDSQESIDVGKEYQAPSNADQIVDVAKGTVIDKKDLSPTDVIKVTAQQHGIELKKVNSGCKKCYGRMYIGLDQNNAPIPCNCIFKYNTEIEKQNAFLKDLKGVPKTSNREQTRKQWFGYSQKQRRQLLEATLKSV